MACYAARARPFLAGFFFKGAAFLVWPADFFATPFLVPGRSLSEGPKYPRKRAHVVEWLAAGAESAANRFPVELLRATLALRAALRAAERLTDDFRLLPMMVRCVTSPSLRRVSPSVTLAVTDLTQYSESAHRRLTREPSYGVAEQRVYAPPNGAYALTACLRPGNRRHPRSRSTS